MQAIHLFIHLPVQTWKYGEVCTAKWLSATRYVSLSDFNKFVNSNGQWLFIGSALLITCYSVHSCPFTKL